MQKFKIRPCDNPECDKEYKQYNSTVKHCSGACKIAHKGKPKAINKVSEKKKAQDIVYHELRRLFLNREENKVCPITGEATNQVHHRAGRVGSLYLDTRYWLAVSHEGHQKIELNPIWAKEMGYSIDRLTKP